MISVLLISGDLEGQSSIRLTHIIDNSSTLNLGSLLIQQVAFLFEQVLETSNTIIPRFMNQASQNSQTVQIWRNFNRQRKIKNKIFQKLCLKVELSSVKKGVFNSETLVYSEICIKHEKALENDSFQEFGRNIIQHNWRHFSNQEVLYFKKLHIQKKDPLNMNMFQELKNGKYLFSLDKNDKFVNIRSFYQSTKIRNTNILKDNKYYQDIAIALAFMKEDTLTAQQDTINDDSQINDQSSLSEDLQLFDKLNQIFKNSNIQEILRKSKDLLLVDFVLEDKVNLKPKCMNDLNTKNQQLKVLNVNSEDTYDNAHQNMNKNDQDINFKQIQEQGLSISQDNSSDKGKQLELDKTAINNHRGSQDFQFIQSNILRINTKESINLKQMNSRQKNTLRVENTKQKLGKKQNQKLTKSYFSQQLSNNVEPQIIENQNAQHESENNKIITNKQKSLNTIDLKSEDNQILKKRSNSEMQLGKFTISKISKTQQKAQKPKISEKPKTQTISNINSLLQNATLINKRAHNLNENKTKFSYYQPKENEDNQLDSNECQIRFMLNLQDLDMLVVRKEQQIEFMEEPISESNTLREGQDKIKTTVLNFSQNIQNCQHPDESCHFTWQDCSFSSNQKKQIPFLDFSGQIDDHMKDSSNMNNKSIQIQKVKSYIVNSKPLNINIQSRDQHQEILKLNKEDSSSYSPVQLSPSPVHIQVSEQVITKKQSSSSQKEELLKQQSSYLIQKQNETYEVGFKIPVYQNSISPRVLNQSRYKVNSIMQTITYVKRFINKLKLSSKKVLFRNISKPQFQIINDITSDYDYYLFEGFIHNSKKISLLKKCYYQFRNPFHIQFLQQFMQGKYLFSIDSVIRLIWDIFIIVFTFYLILMIPITHIVSFAEDSFINIFHKKFVQWILGIETFLNLNSEVYLHGVIIRDRKVIFKSNLKNFLKDLFILVFYAFSQSYHGSFQIVRYLDYLAFIKYLDIPQKVTEFEIKLQLNDSFKNWMKLIKLEITVLILIHVTCCIFLDIGLFEQQQNQNSWLNKFELDNSTIQQQYFSSLYFMTITICTIGYGDISPYTFNERLFIMMVAILSTSITAYTFSQISEIVKFEDNKNESFNKLMTGINYQMKVGGLSMKLQQKVRKFYQYFHIQSQHSKNFANQFMNQLPQNLQEEVLLDLNRENINSINLFKNLSNKCQQKISLQIKQKQFMPGEIILHENELNNSLYFVNDGSLEINSTLKINEKDDLLGTKFQQLQKKDVFGYEGFLLGEVSSYSVKSSGSSIVSFIDKQVFLDILKQFPTDYEKFLFIKDQTIYGSVNANIYKLKCISCGMTDHQLTRCPYISLSIKYKPQKLVNERRPYVRKRIRFSCLLKNIQFIQESAMEAQANNDQALIIEALNLLQSCVIKKSEDEEDIDQSASSLSLSVQINKHTIQNLDDLQTSIKDESQFKRKQSGVSLNHESLSRISSKNIKSNENSSFTNRDSKVTSYKKERASDLESQPVLIQQSSQQQEYSIVDSESQLNFNEEQKEENSQKFENQKSYDDQQLIKQNMIRERKNRASSFHYNKNSEISPQRDKKHLERNQSTNRDINTSQKTSIYQIMKINNSQNKQEISKDFQETEIDIIRQTFEERQKKSKQEQKYLQRELSQKIKLQNTPSLEDILSDSNKFQKVIKNLERQKSNQNCQEENVSDKGYFKLVSLAAKGQFKSRKKSVTLDNFTFKENNSISIQHTKQSQNIGGISRQNTIQNYEKLNNKVLNDVVENQKNTETKRKVQEPQINSTEYQIRCQHNLQDIDMLLVRKQYILMQQKNLIQDYIEVADNEINIDSLHNYLYYYKAHNANNIIFKYNQKQFYKGRSLYSNKKRTASQKKRQSKYLYAQIQKLNFQIKQ
ncbi:hypothetical protein ABPG72_002528 [Tetrahymena utriculariae]